MKFNFFSIVLVAFSTFIIGCSDNNDNKNDFGRLTVNLTDAPFPHDLVAEANVTVFKVEARYKGGLELGAQAIDSNPATMKTEQGNHFVILMEEEVQVNLLDLTNGITKNLVDTEVPAGYYDLIRVYVRGVNVVLTNGTTYDLKVPSGAQSGIKIFIKPGLEVKGGLSADLLLDFDVSSSFVAKGNSEDLNNITGFNFKPVIKASNLSTAGTLMGVISEIKDDAAVGVEGAQVAIFAADTLNTTTFSDVAGSYMIMGLDAGSYTIEVEKEAYLKQTTQEVQINAGNKTVKDFELVLE
ncbi:hypothetical protein KCTC52924_03254 [Arenibacter antarcticus]|uniref:DUF4382 domain-containing protein n=1 Tax=Arenibacter antarcticus TaxID=2040469 RepID=A0ABW5VG07_9FLAO|nr:DUF4382 domain-containing protein [Arenibacter sp. H213]MCM4166324.1 hypothetical protein [Arenibacter sp. H213]